MIPIMFQQRTDLNEPIFAIALAVAVRGMNSKLASRVTVTKEVGILSFLVDLNFGKRQ